MRARLASGTLPDRLGCRCSTQMQSARRETRRAFGSSASSLLASGDMSPSASAKAHDDLDLDMYEELPLAWETPRRSSHLSRFARRTFRPSTLLLALTLMVLAVIPAAAVNISFQNCLPESYRDNDPPRLQWVPEYVEAVFDTSTDKHNLQVIVWGNVTGSMNQFTPPPAGDPYWNNDDEEEGKIVETPEPDAQRVVATTLLRQVEVVTYRPYRDVANFCTEGVVDDSCPVGPVFDDSIINNKYGLPSFNLSHDFYSSYAFTSFSTTFIIIWGDAKATNIGCVSATITPDLGNLAWLITFLPLTVLILSGAAVLYAAIYSPWGNTDIFHWSSNYGRDLELIRLVTPGFADCLHYIQFAVLTGSLTLNYPGFFQPILSKAAWATLMFNQSFVTGAEPWNRVVDGMILTRSEYGLGRLAQLSGMRDPQDIWAGMMVWLLGTIGAVLFAIQAAFFSRWLYRRLTNTTKEDLRAKNFPFSVGNVVRIAFNWLFLPAVSLSTFQLVVAPEADVYLVALAVLVLAIFIAFAAWLMWFIITIQPKSVLFDDLPTVLLYGTLYNTYSDESAAFALVPMVLTFLRGVTIGAVQPSGIAQIVLLAICEVIQLLTIHAFRPFQSTTSMNAWHTVLSVLRLVSVMLMVTFLPELGVTDGAKGWIGYIILLIHAIVLVFVFSMNALLTIFEVAARQLGAGGDDRQGLQRGGLARIFGMRQLAKRSTPREGPSRASQLSTSGMLSADNASKVGYMAPGSHLRSESGASLGGFMMPRGRSNSALDSLGDRHSSHHRHIDSGSSYMPGTPGADTGTFSFINSPIAARGPQGSLPMETVDPYYRPPRRRREFETESYGQEAQRSSLVIDQQHLNAPPAEAGEGAEISRGATPAPPPAASNAVITNLPNRPDYATREVDFYYGVRGPALNSDGPGRKLGTGPADPTGPVATATGWIRNMFGGKTKEKGKGFEVVRSSRMPPHMKAQAGFGSETPPEGIPVAMGVLRNGPIDSDDDEPQTKSPKKAGALLTQAGEPRGPDSDEPDSPVAERLPDGRQTEGEPSALEVPDIPRKSSKRNSAMYSDASGSHGRSASSGTLGKLPFDRADSHRRLSTYSSMDFPEELVNMGVKGKTEERPASFGMVSQHSIARVDPHLGESDLLGSSAELVDANALSRKTSKASDASSNAARSNV